ncbi:HAD-IIIC family phosphatase [Geodermatophilus nigrescens]
MAAEDARPQSAGSRSDARSASDLLVEARRLAAEQRPAEAARALGQVAVVTRELAPWLAAARQLATLPAQAWARRSVRLAVLGSHTTGHLVPALVTAAASVGVALDVYEGPYGQWQQEILDEASGLAAFAPDVVLLAVDSRELHLPARSEAPAEDLATEVARWTSLWQVLQDRLRATVLQISFVEPPDDEFGSLALTLPGTRRRQVRALDLALGNAAPSGVYLVDAEAVAARVGSATWSDRRYWFRSKHAIGLGAVPELAAEVAQVLAGVLGLNRKVVVLDLDGTVWGGVVGEDGPEGITIGDGPAGEAFQAFQEYLVALQQRGMLLVAVSKNNEAEARAPFLERPEMRLRLEHFAAFLPSWDDKPESIRRAAEDLGLGLDSFVFVDDNPVEREAVRRVLPEVGVVPLPVEPADYVTALRSFPGMQAASLTADDARRTQQYRTRAEVARVRATAGSREEFLAGLEMVLTVEDVGPANLPRVVQLIGKTNQFTLTGRRHGAAEVQAMAERPGAVTIALRLRDRFDDHGLIAVVLAVPEGDELVVDTWSMSCRVLGRDVEVATMAAVADRARTSGSTRVRGVFVPTGRNTPARTAYASAGFVRVDGPPGADGPDSEQWVLDLAATGPRSRTIRIEA